MTGEGLHVVTGGPGSGKSTLIARLAAEGIATVSEAGRAVIREQRAARGTALPWADRTAFAERMLVHDLANWRAAAGATRPVLFDRGVPDILGYLRLCNLPVPAHVAHAATHCRYDTRVFIAPHWPKIYAKDTERRQEEPEARATHSMRADTYRALGYTLVPLPLAPVAERVAFVLAAIG